MLKKIELFKKKYGEVKKTFGLDEASQRAKMNREIERNKLKSKVINERIKLEKNRNMLVVQKEELSKLKSERFERAARGFLGDSTVNNIKKGDAFGTSKPIKIGISSRQEYNLGFGKKRR